MTGSIFGIAESAVRLTEERAAILTDNIANASTPNYKARDIDFHKLLQETKESAAMTSTNSNHVSTNNDIDSSKLLYRVPMQTSLDGNTVDDDIERKNFMENALRYQVSISFIQNKTDELEKAMQGE